MPKKDSDLQGLTRLLTEVTVGITNLVEAMHQRIVHPPFLPSTPIQHAITGIADITYRQVRWGAQFVGRGLDHVLGQWGAVSDDVSTTDEREAIRAVLNGVIGDYLEKKDNPLQIRMCFRYHSEEISPGSNNLNKAYPTINGNILLMIHGLCMNDTQWTREEHNHGESLAKELGMTPIYLRYNSGRHISSNGQELNDLLEELVSNWPVPVKELVMVTHSMGGLLARSALYYGEKQHTTWPEHLRKLIFLGTPHHGAQLERTGNYLDTILEAIPYAKPFARLGKVRSAGITDLRYGNLIEEDWQGMDRFDLRGDQRQIIPLPRQIDCYSVAAVMGNESDFLSETVGDGLVSLVSAWGQHRDPNRVLSFEDTWVTYQTNHFELLGKPEVFTRMKAWLQ